MTDPSFLEAYVGEDSAKQANLSEDPLAGEGVPQWESGLKRLGGTLGALGGGLAGAALPLAAGFGMGHAIGDLALPGDGTIHHLGAHSGERLGKLVGHGVEALYPSTAHAVQAIKNVSPGEGLARIRALEQTGGDPQMVAAMRDAYNRRRSSLRDQLIAGTA